MNKGDFENFCEQYKLGEKEKETVKQILKVLNGSTEYEAKSILQVAEIALGFASIISFDE